MRQTINYLKSRLGVETNARVVEYVRPQAREAGSDDLAARMEWQKLTNVWSRAQQVEMMSDSDAELRMAAKTVEDTAKDLQKLLAASSLTEAEGTLIRLELATRVARLHAAMSVPPTTASGQATSSATHPAREARMRLADRQSAIEQLSLARQLRMPVLELVLPQIEDDVALLDRKEIVAELLPNELSKVRRVREMARTALARIRTRLSNGATAAKATPEWQEIRATWREVAPLAARKVNPTQRTHAGAKLNAAKDAASRLALAGLMSRPEARLFANKAEDLLERIIANTVTNTRPAMRA